MPILVIVICSPVGSDAPELALVGAVRRPSSDHLVLLGALVLYGGMEIGEDAAELAQEPLYVLGAALEHGAIWLVSGVVGEDLVHQVEVAFVTDLLDVAPEDSFALLGQRRLLSYPRSLARLLAPGRSS